MNTESLTLINAANEQLKSSCSACYASIVSKKCDTCNQTKLKRAFSSRQYRFRSRGTCEDCLSNSISSDADQILSCCPAVSYCSLECMEMHKIKRHFGCTGKDERVYSTLEEVANQVPNLEDRLIVVHDDESCSIFRDVFCNTSIDLNSYGLEHYFLLIRGFSPKEICSEFLAIIEGLHPEFSYASVFIFKLYRDAENIFKSRIQTYDLTVTSPIKVQKFFRSHTCSICYDFVTSHREQAVCSKCANLFHWDCIKEMMEKRSSSTENHQCPQCMQVFQVYCVVNGIYFLGDKVTK